MLRRKNGECEIKNAIRRTNLKKTFPTKDKQNDAKNIQIGHSPMRSPKERRHKDEWRRCSNHVLLV